MNIIKGNMWCEIGKADLILATGNSFITVAGNVVMGAGAAKQMRDMYPGIDKSLGSEILFSANFGRAGYSYEDFHEYGVIISNDIVVSTPTGRTELGLFQTKYHFKDESDLDLVEYSCSLLKEFILPEYDKVVMNYPGIGLGQRTEEEIFPILDSYLGSADNIYIYKKSSTR